MWPFEGIRGKRGEVYLNMKIINENNEIQKLDLIFKKKTLNERQDILRQFLEEINKERIGTKFKPITGRAVAMKLSHLKDNHTLYFFLSQCKDYKNRNKSFSKYFFGALKVK